MIVGNVEEYIIRCLDSFRPIADEICVVRAIGAAKPDRTLDICRDKYGAKTAEYRNKPEHADWPHIDDFAAARQMSFDMATGDYLFWCDSDDVLEAGADVVRELADRGGYAAFMFPYRILGRGVNVPRERMVLRGSGYWQYPVHECFRFYVEPISGIFDNRVIVTHMPMHDKRSGQRNLRILESIPPEQMNAGLLYHLYGEYGAAGDMEKCIATAKRALEHPDLGTPERYEILMDLARESKKPEVKHAYLHEAYKADPTRREALGLLACHAMDYQQADQALAYARQMMSILPPANAAWNNREAVYSWLGDDIYAQALRCAGMRQEAEAVRRQALAKHGGPIISLIHATRGRPTEASRARKLWLDFADHPERIEHLFVIDDDDRDSHPLLRMHSLVVPAGGGCVRAWNYGAFAIYAPVIVLMSDDFIPPMKWDKLILERIGDMQKPAVLAVSDGIRKDNLICLPICTRSYLLHDYFLLHPEFKSVYSDDWFTELAYRREQVIDARDLVFQHNHPIATGKPLDQTYLDQNSEERYRDGKATLERLRTGNDWSFVHGWFNYWPLYESVAATLKDGDTIAEVGVWMGRSVCFMGQLLKRMGKRVRIIAVDNFRGEANQPAHEKIVQDLGGNFRRVFEENLRKCGVADMVEILEGDSAAMAANVKDGSLAFCYIDAGHTYDAVISDVTAWEKKVKPDGILAGHDAQHDEVMKAVRERIKNPIVIGNCWLRDNGAIQKLQR